eukprot:TRINITY_DN65487_c10_g18_i1.p1 TRINITY_DN65487_c10_g18~~TRINITY_DN65487_c10_g18_i1.p1  ORF type:complete len:195 (+),score=9.57 TRINITY_DN65487_c10_g18_i1:70-585(+)
MNPLETLKKTKEEALKKTNEMKDKVDKVINELKSLQDGTNDPTIVRDAVKEGRTFVNEKLEKVRELKTDFENHTEEIQKLPKKILAENPIFHTGFIAKMVKYQPTAFIAGSTILTALPMSFLSKRLAVFSGITVGICAYSITKVVESNPLNSIPIKKPSLKNNEKDENMKK